MISKSSTKKAILELKFGERKAAESERLAELPKEDILSEFGFFIGKRGAN